MNKATELADMVVHAFINKGRSDNVEEASRKAPELEGAVYVLHNCDQGIQWALLNCSDAADAAYNRHIKT
jgi:hypothetical protein